MPGPTGKKRIGSRRRVVPHVEMPEELSEGDQPSQPEEIGESFSGLSNEEHTPLETYHKSSRRKLGSNRQRKKDNSEQSAIKPHHQLTKEVEQNVQTENLQAETITTGQEVRQREFSEVEAYDSMYGTHLYSAYTPGDASDPSYHDSDVERHQPIGEKLHLEQDSQESVCKQENQSDFSVSIQHIDAEKEDINEELPQPAEAFQGDHGIVKLKETDFPGNADSPTEKSSHCVKNVESKNNVEEVNDSPPVGELLSKEEHEPFDFSQAKDAQRSDQSEIEEIKSPESDQMDHPEIVTHEIETCPENLTDEVLEIHKVDRSVKSPDSCSYPQNKEEQKLLEENTKVLSQKDNFQAPNTNEALINIEQMEPAPCREEVINDQVKSKQEQCTDGLLSPMMDSVFSQPETSFVFDTHSQDNTASTDKHRESFSSARNRKKLGSNRWSKGSYEMVYAAETYSNVKDDAELPKINNVTFEIEAAEKTKIELKDSSDTFPDEKMHGLDRGNTHSDSTKPQLLIQLSNCEEMPEEVLPVDEVKTKTEEENETSSQNGNLGDTLEISMPESRFNEDTEIEDSPAIATISSPKAETSSDEHELLGFSQVCEAQHPDREENETLSQNGNLGDTLEISIPESRFNEDTEIEDSPAIATISSPKAETTVDEHEHFGFSQVSKAQDPGENLTEEVNSSETEQTKDSEILTDGPRGDVDKTLKALVNEFFETHMSDLSALDSILNPQDNPEEQYMLEENTEILEQTKENNHAHDTKETVNTEKSNPTKSQDHDEEAQRTSDDKQSANGILSGMPESRLYSQSVQSEDSSQSEDTTTSTGQQKGSFSQNRNRRKLGSHRRNKGAFVKNFAAESYKEVTDSAAGNGRDEKDPPETKDTVFAIETTEMENTEKKGPSEEECGPTKATIFLPKEKTEEQHELLSMSGDDSTQHLDNNISNMPNQMVNLVEVDQLNSIDDSAVTEICSPAGIMQMEASVERESYKEQASQDHTKPIFKATETIEAVKSQIIQEDDSISLNPDKDAIASSQGEVPNTFCIPTQDTNINSTSNLSVQQSEETFQVSSKEESLENVLEAENSALKEIRDNLEVTGLLNVSSTKKRRMGSTRRSRMSRKPEAEMDKEDDTRSLENVGVLEELPQTEVLPSQRAKSSGKEEQEYDKAENDQNIHKSTSESKVIPTTDEVTTLLSEQVSSHEATQHDGNLMQDQDELMGQPSNIQAINTESEGAPDQNLKSPRLNLAHQKRRMGSTRRSLGTKSKRDLELKLDLSNEVGVAAPVQDLFCQSENQKLMSEGSGLGPTNQENVCDPPSSAETLQSGEENLTLEHHPVEDDVQKQSTSTKLDMLSESELKVRKRKMGSHRKSKVQQTHGDQSEKDNMMQKQAERAEKIITHEQVDDAIHGSEEPQSDLSDPSKSMRNNTSEEALPPRVHHQVTLNVSAGEAGNSKAKPFHVVMVGDSNVGKTSFMKRAENGKFFPDLPASAGLDTCLWTVVVDGKPVVLQLWDTAGQERFRSITHQVFHRAHAFLLMYDITSSQSFTAVHYWATCIHESATKNVPVLLLGNKSDHVERHVSTEEAQKVAKTLNADFMECSAVSGDNVIQSLEAVARLLSHKDDVRDETLELHKEPPKKKAGCC
nr:titin isoform X7 [Syngnathus scovelli]